MASCTRSSSTTICRRASAAGQGHRLDKLNALTKCAAPFSNLPNDADALLLDHWHSTNKWALGGVARKTFKRCDLANPGGGGDAWTSGRGRDRRRVAQGDSLEAPRVLRDLVRETRRSGARDDVATQVPARCWLCVRTDLGTGRKKGDERGERARARARHNCGRGCRGDVRRRAWSPGA